MKPTYPPDVNVGGLRLCLPCDDSSGKRVYCSVWSKLDEYILRIIIVSMIVNVSYISFFIMVLQNQSNDGCLFCSNELSHPFTVNDRQCFIYFLLLPSTHPPLVLPWPVSNYPSDCACNLIYMQSDFSPDSSCLISLVFYPAFTAVCGLWIYYHCTYLLECFPKFDKLDVLV